MEKSPEEIQAMPTGEKRELLMKPRKEELRKLIQAYYRERGWSPSGIPTPATLKQIGLWDVDWEKKNKLQEAVSRIQEKFGKEKLSRGVERDV